MFLLNIENNFDNFLNNKIKWDIFLNCRKTKYLIITRHLSYQLTFCLNLYSEKIEK